MLIFLLLAAITSAELVPQQLEIGLIVLHDIQSSKVFEQIVQFETQFTIIPKVALALNSASFSQAFFVKVHAITKQDFTIRFFTASQMDATYRYLATVDERIEITCQNLKVKDTMFIPFPKSFTINPHGLAFLTGQQGMGQVNLQTKKMLRQGAVLAVQSDGQPTIGVCVVAGPFDSIQVGSDQQPFFKGLVNSKGQQLSLSIISKKALICQDEGCLEAYFGNDSNVDDNHQIQSNTNENNVNNNVQVTHTNTNKQQITSDPLKQLRSFFDDISVKQPKKDIEQQMITEEQQVIVNEQQVSDVKVNHNIELNAESDSEESNSEEPDSEESDDDDESDDDEESDAVSFDFEMQLTKLKESLQHPQQQLQQVQTTMKYDASTPATKSNLRSRQTTSTTTTEAAATATQTIELDSTNTHMNTMANHPIDQPVQSTTRPIDPPEQTAIEDIKPTARSSHFKALTKTLLQFKEQQELPVEIPPIELVEIPAIIPEPVKQELQQPRESYDSPFFSTIQTHVPESSVSVSHEYADYQISKITHQQQPQQSTKQTEPVVHIHDKFNQYMEVFEEDHTMPVTHKQVVMPVEVAPAAEVDSFEAFMADFEQKKSAKLIELRNNLKEMKPAMLQHNPKLTSISQDTRSEYRDFFFS